MNIVQSQGFAKDLVDANQSPEDDLQLNVHP